MPISPNKEKTIVYLLKEDKQEIKERAERSGISVSAYIAAIVRKNLRRKEQPTVIHTPELKREFGREYRIKREKELAVRELAAN